MIRNLNIQNFQSHENSTLEFHKGLNVIVGPSDIGKTAILRALKLLIWNRPGGDSFRSDWGGDTSVKIETKNHSITRSKTKSSNEYRLNELSPFKAFGTNVPEEIQKALNFDEINLQEQHDKSFLISETSGNVAAHFNQIANLDKIDIGLQKIQKVINTTATTIQYTKKEIESKKEQLKEFPDLHKLESSLQYCETLQSQKKVIKQDLKSLCNVIEQIEKLQKKIKNKSKVLLIENSINFILKLYEQKRRFISEKTKLKNLSLKIYYLQEAIKKAEKIKLAEATINSILNMYQEHTKFEVSRNKMVKLYISITNNKTMQETARNQLQKLEIQYKKDFPKICPLCNTKIK